MVNAIVSTANAEETVAELEVVTKAAPVEINNEEVAPVDAIEGGAGISEEVMAMGKKVYATCSACHGADGNGIPGVFPAIAGSPISTGPVEDHINIVMFGKAGTAMAAFANQLNDEEIAAVITYQRNSFGNDTGDAVLPADIKAKRN